MNVKLARDPRNDQRWYARSTSAPHRIYTLDAVAGQAVCDCQGYRTAKHCKHSREATFRMEQALTTYSGQAAALALGDEPMPVEVRPVIALLPSREELASMNEIARTVVSTRGQLVPTWVDTPAKAWAVMLAGWELGMRPMTSFWHLFMVNGRVELSAQAMTGVVLAREPRAHFEWHEISDQRAEVTLRRPQRPPVTCEYTIEMARRSGQLESGKRLPWNLYTRDMLAWNAVKRACRLGAPDLMNAISGLGYRGAFSDGPEPGEWQAVEVEGPQDVPATPAELPAAENEDSGPRPPEEPLAQRPAPGRLSGPSSGSSTAST